MRQAISSPGAPKAIGPYSSGLRVGSLYFVSGQIPLDPATGELIEGGIVEQTGRALQSVKSLLEEAGLNLESVVRTTVFLSDINDFAEMNRVYETFFAKPYPARSTIQAARLPRNAKVEIDAIAVYDAMLHSA